MARLSFEEVEKAKSSVFEFLTFSNIEFYKIHFVYFVTFD